MFQLCVYYPAGVWIYLLFRSAATILLSCKQLSIAETMITGRYHIEVYLEVLTPRSVYDKQHGCSMITFHPVSDDQSFPNLLHFPLMPCNDTLFPGKSHWMDIFLEEHGQGSSVTLSLYTWVLYEASMTTSPWTPWRIQLWIRVSQPCSPNE